MALSKSLIGSGRLRPAAWSLVCGLSLGLAASVMAQEPSPADWDLEIRTDKATYDPGASVEAFAGVAARGEGLQGWSYGVKHDTDLLTIESATSAGTDVPGLFSGGFEQTAIITQNNVKKGFIQAIILSLVNRVVVPPTAFFSMAKVGYTVATGACSGKNGNITTRIEFTEELAVPNSPPVQLNLTVDGKAIVPNVVKNRDIEVACDSNPPPEGLVLKFDEVDCDVVADGSATYELKVLLGNSKTAGGFDVQGWSYGVQLDTAELEALKGEPGADSKSLKGGKGPDFLNYTLNDQSQDGSVRGVTVGAVIDLDSPANNVLPVGAGAMKHIDTITLKPKKTIPAGGASKMTTISFSDKLGGDRPLEILIVVGGEGVAPDAAAKKELELLPSGGGNQPSFIRGDSNNDARIDIADGIWIINMLFYGGQQTACLPAADADGDGSVKLTDAMFLFLYQLQVGHSSNDLAPAPPAPFPSCGTTPDATLENCPLGSTTCS